MEKMDNDDNYIVFQNDKGFLNTRLIEVNKKVCVNFDTMEVYPQHQRTGVATKLIEEALSFWGVAPQDVYFVAMSDGSRSLKTKFEFGKNIWK